MSNVLHLAFLVIVVRMILKCLPSWFTVVPAVVHTCTYVENSEGGYKLTYQIGDRQDAYYVDDEHLQAELTQGERVNLIVLQQAPLRVWSGYRTRKNRPRTRRRSCRGIWSRGLSCALNPGPVSHLERFRIATVKRVFQSSKASMHTLTKNYLLFCGCATAAGAALHIAVLFGGPEWYAFFGAPRGLVELARAGHIRAPISCVVIACVLAVLSAYAYSGAGVIRRLPLLRTALALIAAVLLLRGALFVPLILWRPETLAGVCDCRTVDAFILITSALCLLVGLGYALGALTAKTR